MASKWSNVIKSEAAETVIAPYYPLNLDVLRQAQEEDQAEYEAKQRAAEEEARRQAAAEHDRALYQQGWDAGWQEGRENVREAASAETRRALELFAQAERLREEALQQAELDVIELALAIAEKVIHREMTFDRNIFVAQVSRLLTLITEKGLIRLRVHPDCVEALHEHQSSLLGPDGKPVRLWIEGDETLSADACILESPHLFIRTSIKEQLEAIQEALLCSHDSPSSETA